MLNNEEVQEVINGLRMEGITDNVIIAIVMANIKRDLTRLMEGIRRAPSNSPRNIRVGLDYLEAARS
jgi:hypothetical protein